MNFTNTPCDCYGEQPDGSDCEGQCCGIGQCMCTPIIAEAWAASRGMDIDSVSIANKILFGDTEGSRELRKFFGLARVDQSSNDV